MSAVVVRLGDVETLRRSWLAREVERELGVRVDRFLFRAYWRQEKTYVEIAEDLGVSASTVGRWMRLLGWDMRSVARDAMAGREP